MSTTAEQVQAQTELMHSVARLEIATFATILANKAALEGLHVFNEIISDAIKTYIDDSRAKAELVAAWNREHRGSAGFLEENGS